MLSFQKVLSFSLLLAVAGYSRCTLAALTITDIFEVDIASTLPWSCEPYLGKLNQYLSETRSLIGVACQAVNDAAASGPNRNAAYRIVRDFFKATTPAQYTAIFLRCNAVQRFLQGGVSAQRTNNGLVNIKPYLFCSDQWRVIHEWYDPYEDNGQPRVENGIPVPIEDVLTRPVNEELFPYYSAILDRYTMDEEYPVPLMGLCSDTANLGSTIAKGSDVGVMVLCPPSFSGSALGAQPMLPQDFTIVMQQLSNQQYGSLQLLTDVMPGSATFFHELFHLVLGSENTPPGGSEIYGLDNCLKLPFDTAVNNPESYVFMALGYFNHLNTATPPGVNTDGPPEFVYGAAAYWPA